jgi:uncharacterized protein YqgC (DUF456 family)
VTYLVWTLSALLMLAGLAGTLVPLLPGTLVILAAAVVHKLLLPLSLSWTVIGWLAAIWFLSLLVDLACTLLGTKLFGGTKWGMAGAGGGALVGMFFSLPALVLGSILGAVVAEKLGAKRSNADAIRAGAGAALGFVLSAAARFGCAVVMIALFVIAAWPR